MRTLVALVLAALALNAAAQEHFIDGDVLYQRLQRKDPSSITYIFGVFDAIQIVQYHGPGTAQYFCAPAGVTGARLAEGVRDFLESDPSMRQLPAGILVLRAFISMFPCGTT
jgi:hypothetical protein